MGGLKSGHGDPPCLAWRAPCLIDSNGARRLGPRRRGGAARNKPGLILGPPPWGVGVGRSGPGPSEGAAEVGGKGPRPEAAVERGRGAEALRVVEVPRGWRRFLLAGEGGG